MISPMAIIISFNHIEAMTSLARIEQLGIQHKQSRIEEAEAERIEAEAESESESMISSHATHAFWDIWYTLQQ